PSKPTPCPYTTLFRSYTITDSNGDSSTATVSITVNGLPLARNDSYGAVENQALTTGNVLSNDDLGDTPTGITAFDATSVKGGTVASNGDGTFSYKPASGFFGIDTFGYTITDSSGDNSTANI